MRVPGALVKFASVFDHVPPMVHLHSSHMPKPSKIDLIRQRPCTEGAVNEVETHKLLEVVGCTIYTPGEM